jgi:hypothetical protein
MDRIIATELTNIMNSVITNTNPNINKDKGIYVYAGCDIQAGGLTSYDNLYYYQIIPPVKNSNGTYSVPDLSSFSTTLDDSISFYVSNLQWNFVPFEADDVRLNSATNPIDNEGFLEISASYITNSASSGGAFWLKLTVFDGAFQIFNGDGNQIPETPMVLALNQHGTNATVTVNGGDSGRGFVLQSSAALTAWTNCSPVTFISPTNDLLGAQPSQFVYPVTNRSLFFRTAMTNLPPM